MNRRRAPTITVFSILLTIIFVPYVRAADSTIYRWLVADVALRYPDGWTATEIDAENRLVLALESADHGAWLTIFPEDTNEEALRGLLDAEIAARDMQPLAYQTDALWGRSALRAEIVSANRARTGYGVVGRLPDDRAVLFLSHAPPLDAALILHSLVLSVKLDPPMPSYGLLWVSADGEETTFSKIAIDNGRVYALDPAQGVTVFDSETGVETAAYPFSDPAQPTDIEAHDGVIYIADSVCRCIRRRAADDGTALDPLGSFGGGAPFDIAVSAAGVIYAVDRSAEGYLLYVIDGESSTRHPLQFNNAAPPRLALDRAGGVWVVEWLQSLMDGEVTAAVAHFDPDAAKTDVPLHYWIEGLPPDAVRDVASDADGNLALVTADGVRVFDDNGAEVRQIEVMDGARGAAFTMSGGLFTLALTDDRIKARDLLAPPRRLGNAALIADVPVVGRLDDLEDRQLWTFDGEAGEIITVSAVDQSRTFAGMLGLDMALRVFAPDGSEIAYNDDQLGLDLFGVYDAQVRDLALIVTGTYQVIVERVQGGGTYTLAFSRARTVEHETVTRLEGRLQDAVPFEAWRFDGRAGEALTFTMIALSGDLDPALELKDPNGETIIYNDDAFDPELGTNAQIVSFTLPQDGIYTLEASRFEGAGRYELVIVRTN